MATSVPPIEKQKLPLRFRTGRLRIEELLSPEPADSLELAKAREFSLEGLNGLRVGERVTVFVDRELYEGGCVINFHKGSCKVGILLPPAGDLSFSAENQDLILKTIREGRTNLRQLTSRELSSWIIVDAAGIARQFVRELDMERLSWRDIPK